MLNIYMGWDPREVEAYEVAAFSFMRRTSQPLKIEPLMRKALEHEKLLTRPVETKDGRLWCAISKAPMATEFAISRFCVPFLQKEGWALFCDCDVLALDDVANLFDLADDRYAVMVVKHDHNPAETVKMDGQVQTTYARKNWSSVILWNCSHPSNRKLDREALNNWPGMALHQFRWLDDAEIGELPIVWNWLAGVDSWGGELAHEWGAPSLVHYTLGGPWFGDQGKVTEFDDEWLQEHDIRNAWMKPRRAA